MTATLYLGTHMPSWLWKPELEGVPLFVSHERLRPRRTPFPRALTAYAVDSGAYTHLTRHGRWVETPEEYVAALRRYWDQIGPFDFAGQQDSLCSPAVFDACQTATGIRPTVREQQSATVANYLRLVELAPELPIVPTLQGVTYEDYMAHVDMFAANGVDLTAVPVVGVGSLVGKPPDHVERIGTGLHDRGIARLHGFGVKGSQIDAAGHHMSTVDSMAWSTGGRHRPMPDCTHPGTCANCVRFALGWRADQIERLTRGGDGQLALAI